MNTLPILSGQECVKALIRLGFYIKRQHGSHIIMRQDDPFRQVVVPNHKTLDRGTLYSIIKQAGISVEELTGK